MALKGKIERIEGKLIALPHDMDYDVAIKTLTALSAEWNSAIDINEKIEAPLLDAAIAFTTVFRDTIGTVDGNVSIKRIEGPDGEIIEALWGSFKLIGLSGHLSTKVAMHRGKPVLSLVGTTMRKHEDQVMAILTKTRELLASKSIYKGQALRMNVDQFDPMSDDPFLYAPTFMKVPTITEAEVVLNPDVQAQVRMSLINPILYHDVAKKAGIPFKRGVLLEGTFGVGKTLLSTLVARMAVDREITFIHLTDPTHLANTIEFASQYQPAVIFCEDIDRVTSGERDSNLDEILNVVDGTESKSRDIMLVFTTNALTSINRAMLRKGRLDSVIHIDAPNAESTKRLMWLYGAKALASEANLDEAATVMAGSIPADIREVLERAKLAALPRYAYQHGFNGRMKLNGVEILLSAQAFVAERKFLDQKDERKPTVLELAANAFVNNMAQVIEKVSTKHVGTRIDKIIVEGPNGRDSLRIPEAIHEAFATDAIDNATNGDANATAQGEN